MNYFIFDLDNTLFHIKDNIITKNVSSKLLEKIRDKGFIILFSNAKYSYCNYWLDILNIKKYFSVIISSDYINGFKPNPLLYQKINNILGINQKDNIYFFDDITINLETSKQHLNKKWITILINNIKKENKKYIDYKFDSINTSLEFIINNVS